MPSKEIAVTEDAYECLDAYRRNDESFSDALERLLGCAHGDWRTHFGFLDEESSREFAEVVGNGSERN